MKILLIHDFGQAIGGAEAVVAADKAGLIAAGHTVKVLAGTPVDAPGAFNDYAFTTAETTKLQKFASYLHNGAAVTATKVAIADFQPDIIHIHTATKFSPAAIRMAAAAAPTFMTLHDYGLLYPRLHKYLARSQFCGIGDDACCVKHAGLLRYWFEFVRTGRHLRLSNKLIGYIAPSRYVQYLGESFGLDIFTIRNGVSLNQPTPRTSDNVLYVGRLEPEKGVAQLIEQFAIVASQVPTATLTIAGTGSQLDALKSQAEHLKLTNKTTFAGYVAPNKTAELYAAAAVVVVPSLWPEPFGLVGPEAMSAGRPVIASGRGGISEWLESGVNGLIADPNAATALADACISLLTNAKLYAKLATHAVASSRAFSADQHIMKLEAAYDAATHASRQ